MYIKRYLEKTLFESINTFPAIIVTGPRQSGKTTLLKKNLLPEFNYVSLDELDIRSFAENDPRGFLERYPIPLIIDEIQNAPGILSYIKARIDEDRKPGQWVLTGSQQFNLMKDISESMAGRVAILNLNPFAIGEIIKKINIDKSIAEDYIDQLITSKKLPGKYPPCGKWLIDGGYPEINVNKKISKNLWFSSYIQSYIDRDVRGNIKNENLRDFERFVTLLASRTAQELNLSRLSGDVGVSVVTIKSWISLLEASSVIYLLQPYYKNFGKRIIKNPKLYFMDTGLLSYLVKLREPDHLLFGPMGGAIFETAVVTNFVKRFSAFADPAALYYWRNVSGIEIDLLIETSGGITPVEVKLASTISHHNMKSINNWMKISETDGPGLIVSNYKYTGLLDGRIYNVHYSLL